VVFVKKNLEKTTTRLALPPTTKVSGFRAVNSMNISTHFPSRSYADFWPFPSPRLNVTTCLVAAVVAGIFLYFSYSFTNCFEYVRSKITSVISRQGSVAVSPAAPRAPEETGETFKACSS